MTEIEKSGYPVEAMNVGPEGTLGHIRCLSVVPVDLEKLLAEIEAEESKLAGL